MTARKIILLSLTLALLLANCALPVPVELPRSEAPAINQASANAEPTAAGQAPETAASAITSPTAAAGQETRDDGSVSAQATATPAASPASPADNLQTPLVRQSASFLRYILQPGTPVGIENFVHPEAGCSWMGVGGQVFSLQAEPVTGLVVELGGTLNGIAVSELAITGGATVFGPGGFEITLGDRPLASDGTLWLQVLNLSGVPLSERIYFDTYAECSRNLVLLNFTEITRFQVIQYLPWVDRAEFIFHFPNMFKNATIRP